MIAKYRDPRTITTAVMRRSDPVKVTEADMDDDLLDEAIQAFEDSFRPLKGHAVSPMTD